MDNKYKIVFIDIDGTLVNDEKIVPKENIDTIKKLKNEGIEVVLASGRPYHSIEKYSNIVGATPYIIGSNGGVVVNFKEDKILYDANIEKKLALEVLKFIKQNNLFTAITMSGNLVLEKEMYSLTKENRDELIEVDSLEGYLKKTNESIIKFSVMSDQKKDLEDAREKMINKFNLTITNVDTFVIPKKYRKNGKNPFIMDIMQEYVSKGEAIKILCKYLNFNTSETVILGDGMNDIEMFELDAYKVAMGNAANRIKEMADYVTKTNNEAGVAYKLNEIFNHKKVK